MTAGRRWPKRSGTARLETLANQRPDELSGLQRQRVALARALVLEPDLLILDDPLGRLEERVRGEFRDEIRRVLTEAETTTLVLTSEAREALSMADHLAVMDLGRIVQSGPPAEVYNRPVRLIRGTVSRSDQPHSGAGRVRPTREAT